MKNIMLNKVAVCCTALVAIRLITVIPSTHLYRLPKNVQQLNINKVAKGSVNKWTAFMIQILFHTTARPQNVV